jgi:hypothetical protein
MLPLESTRTTTDLGLVWRNITEPASIQRMTIKAIRRDERNANRLNEPDAFSRAR